MNELRQKMIFAVLVRGFSPRTHKSYLAAISKAIVIEGVSATELVCFWVDSIGSMLEIDVRFGEKR